MPVKRYKTRIRNLHHEGAGAIVRTFGINSLGEAFRGGEFVFGSINVVDLGRRLGRIVTEADIAAEFARMQRELLTPREYKLYQAWKELQPLHNNFFRIYAGINRDDTEYVHLTTEFAGLVENQELWDAVDKFAKDFGGEVELLFEETNLDKSWPVNDPTNITYGPWYGKEERQVGVNVNTLGMTLGEVTVLCQQMAARIEETPLLHRGHVSVM